MVLLKTHNLLLFKQVYCGFADELSVLPGEMSERPLLVPSRTTEWTGLITIKPVRVLPARLLVRFENPRKPSILRFS